MATHEATILWTLQESDDFLKGRYSRAHTWEFDGGLQIPASPSPSIIPIPFSDPAAVDPEEAYVASISSCHMLTYLFLAGKAGYEILSYSDHAVGKMVKSYNRVPWISTVTLYPKIIYAETRKPDIESQQQLHDDAHHQCFIANSVKTEILVEL